MGSNGLWEITLRKSKQFLSVKNTNFQTGYLAENQSTFYLVIAVSPQKKVEMHLLRCQRHSQQDGYEAGG